MHPVIPLLMLLDKIHIDGSSEDFNIGSCLFPRHMRSNWYVFTWYIYNPLKDIVLKSSFLCGTGYDVYM